MRRRGLSLLELVVSISLLALVIVFVLELMPGSLLSLRRTDARLIAENIAQGELQTEVAGLFSGLTPGTQTSLPDQTVDGTTYHLVTRTLPAGAEDPTRLLSLQVTVSWTDRGLTHTAVRERWVSVAIDP